MNKFKTLAASIYQMALDKHEKQIIEDVLAKENFRKIENGVIEKINRIAFVIPELKLYAGGHTSILRLGTKLSEKAYEVCYVSICNQDPIKMRYIAQKNLEAVKGKFYEYEDYIKINQASDVIIATSWQTSYYAKTLAGYKMYFVQDYEPYFFKLNERYLLAKRTYEMGFYIVSLGKWNIQQIQRECQTPSIMKAIDFPYESKEYIGAYRDYSTYNEKTIIKLAVYAKEEGKRLPNLLQNILGKAYEILKMDGITLEIDFFGFDKRYLVSIGKNLGKLEKQELSELYSRSDFGMVASMTNISLVPYEMLAMGLPVIEFQEGSFSTFFPEGSATLIGFDVDDFVSKLKNCLAEPSIIESQIKTAQNYLKGLSWDKSTEQFEQIMRSGCSGECKSECDYSCI